MSSMFILVGIATVLVGVIVFLLIRKSAQKNQAVEQKNNQPNETNGLTLSTGNSPGEVTPSTQAGGAQSLSAQEGGLPSEIIAVITAAIVASTPNNKIPVLRNIVVKSTPKVVWAATGIRQNANIYTPGFDL